MPEKVGLQAELDLRNWSSQVSRYLSDVDRMGKSTSTAGGGMGGAFRSLGSSVGVLGGIGNALGNVATIASGIITANVFTNIAGAVAGAGQAAMSAYADYERLGKSLQSLVAREMSQGQETQKTRQVSAQLTQKEASELEGLNSKMQAEILQRNTLGASIQEQRQRIVELTNSYGENGLNVQTAKARLAEMENQYSTSGTEIDTMKGRMEELNSKNGQLITVIDKVRVNTMSMGEAMQQAGPQAKSLVNWIEQLGIQSPFTSDGIANAFRTALTYGFTTEEAKKLTEAEVDFAAATGQGVEMTGQISLALGQMRSKGKVSGQELIQLTNAGVGVNEILEGMGYTLDDVSRGMVSSDKFIEAVIGDMNIFKGAAKDQANSFSGLLSSMEEIKTIGLREFFTGTFEAVQPYLADFIGYLSSPEARANIRAIGDTLGGTVAGALKYVSSLTSAFMSGGLFGSRSGSFGGTGLLAALGLGPDAVAGIQDVFNKVQGVIGSFQVSGTAGGFSQLGSVIGASLQGAWTNNIQPQLSKWRDNFFGWVTELYPKIPTYLTTLVGNVGTYLSNNWPTISANLSSWSTKFWDWTTTAASGAGSALAAIGVAIAAWANSPEAQEKMNNLGQTLGKMITDAMGLNLQAADGGVKIIGSLTTGLLTAIGTMAGTLIVVGGQIVAGILSGILNSMGADLQPATFSQLGAILGGIGANAKTIAVTVGKNIVIWILNGFNSLVANVSGAFNNGVTAWSDIINKTDWLGVGKAIVSGIADGITKFQGEVLELLKSLAESALSSAKSALGISSPSTEFAEVGSNIVQGLTAGVTSESDTFTSKLMDILNPSAALKEAGMARGQRRDISNLIENMLPSVMGDISSDSLNLGSAIQSGLDAIGSSFSAGQVIQTMERFGYTVEGVTEQISAAYSETEKLLRLENVTSSLSNASQITQLGQTAADRMQSQIDAIQALVDAGGGEYLGVVYDAVTAQDLLTQKLEEQAGVQEEINALTQQQSDLSFLQQQVSILKMVQDAGLDAADVFGGIQFGLDASLTDMIAATSNVVNAMIDQANSDLQIGSPSKVFAEMGEFSGLGIAEGWENVKSQVTGAVSDVINPANVSQPTYAEGEAGSYKTVNIYVTAANGFDTESLVTRIKREVSAGF